MRILIDRKNSWAGVFDDQVLAAAMIVRIVHHADVITLKAASYRLRDRGADTLPSINKNPQTETAHSSTAETAQSSSAVGSGRGR